MAESYIAGKPAREQVAPKMVDHLEIHPTMDSGHRVEVHHTSYEHRPVKKEFAGPHAKVNLPKGHVLAHIAEHMGIPVTHRGMQKRDEKESKTAQTDIDETED